MAAARLPGVTRGRPMGRRLVAGWARRCRPSPPPPPRGSVAGPRRAAAARPPVPPPSPPDAAASAWGSRRPPSGKGRGRGRPGGVGEGGREGAPPPKGPGLAVVPAGASNCPPCTTAPRGRPGRGGGWCVEDFVRQEGGAEAASLAASAALPRPPRSRTRWLAGPGQKVPQQQPVPFPPPHGLPLRSDPPLPRWPPPPPRTDCPRPPFPQRPGEGELVWTTQGRAGKQVGLLLGQPLRSTPGLL